jgi:hypothetical protein
MRKIAKYILFVSLAIGLGRIACFGFAIEKLNRERYELGKVVGDFGPANANEFQVFRRPGNHPFHFEWSIKHRFRFPIVAYQLGQLKHGRSSRKPGDDGFYPTTLKFRRVVRQSLFVELRNDEILLHSIGPVDILARQKVDPQLIDWVKMNWEQLTIDLAGDGRISNHSNSDAVSLLSIRIPSELLNSLDDKERPAMLLQFPDRLILEFHFNDFK